jgi:hypothetical protein
MTSRGPCHQKARAVFARGGFAEVVGLGGAAARSAAEIGRARIGRAGCARHDL